MIFYIPKMRQGGLEKVFILYITSIIDKEPVELWCDMSSRDYLPDHFLENKNLEVRFLSGNRYIRILWVLILCILSKNKTINAVQLDALKPVLIVGIFLRLKINYHERTFVSPDRIKRIKWLLGAAHKSIENIFVNSEDQKQLYQLFFPSIQIVRLYNPIINDRLVHLKYHRSENYKCKNDHRTIVCSGRLDGQKNIDFIVNNAREICLGTNFQKIIFYLDDKSFKLLRSNQYLETRKFTSNFLNEINLIDAAIISTDFEGFSSLLFELNYLGIPVFCNKHSHGFDEMHRNFSFAVFEKNSVSDLIEQINLQFNNMQASDIDPNWVQNFKTGIAIAKFERYIIG